MSFKLYLFAKEDIIDINQLNNNFNIVNLNNTDVENLIKLYNLTTLFHFETQQSFFVKLLNNLKLKLVKDKVNYILFCLENNLMLDYFNKSFSFLRFVVDKQVLLEDLKEKFEFEEYTPNSINKDFNLFKQLLGIEIDKVYCITLFHRNDRQEEIMKQCDKYNMPITFFKTEKDEEDPVRGCATSHLECIKDAKRNNYNNVLILEDDMLFDDNIIQAFFEINETVKVPENFDIFFLGYNSNCGYRYDRNVINLLSAQCAHSYIVSNKAFDEILNNFDKDWSEFKEWNERIGDEDKQNFDVKAIDLFYAKIICHRLKNSFGIYPMISYQQPGHSDIENKDVDYTMLMRNKAKKSYLTQKYVYPTLFLNLKKRQDRLVQFQNNYINEVPIVNVIEAVDGTTFDFKPYLPLFNLQNFGMNKKNPYGSHNWMAGVLGCSMSHILMWNNIVQSQIKDDDYVLILEDDVQLCKNFTFKVNKLLDIVHEDKNWDLLYLGYTDYVNTNDEKLNEKVLKLSGDTRTRGGGTFGYFIRKSGAMKLLKLANELGVQQAIDWFMIEQYDKIVAYKTIEDLVFSKVQNNIKGGDSDVQNRNTRIKIIEDLIQQQKQNLIAQKKKLSPIIESQIEDITEEDPVEEYVETIVEEDLEEEDLEEEDLEEEYDYENTQLIVYEVNLFSYILGLF